MEVIKKQTKRAIKKETIDGKTMIVLDEDAQYNFKILLTSKSKDYGFFNAFTSDLTF